MRKIAYLIFISVALAKEKSLIGMSQSLGYFWLIWKIPSTIYFFISGQKPHECHKCGKRFALGCNMKAHLKTHDPNRATSSKSPNLSIEEDEEETLLNVTD